MIHIFPQIVFLFNKAAHIDSGVRESHHVHGHQVRDRILERGPRPVLALQGVGCVLPGACESRARDQDRPAIVESSIVGLRYLSHDCMSVLNHGMSI